jgi:hypothetical protein
MISNKRKLKMFLHTVVQRNVLVFEGDNVSAQEENT